MFTINAHITLADYSAFRISRTSWMISSRSCRWQLVGERLEHSCWGLGRGSKKCPTVSSVLLWSCWFSIPASSTPTSLKTSSVLDALLAVEGGAMLMIEIVLQKNICRYKIEIALFLSLDDMMIWCQPQKDVEANAAKRSSRKMILRDHIWGHGSLKV